MQNRSHWSSVMCRLSTLCKPTDLLWVRDSAHWTVERGEVIRRSGKSAGQASLSEEICLMHCFVIRRNLFDTLLRYKKKSVGCIVSL